MVKEILEDLKNKEKLRENLYKEHLENLDKEISELKEKKENIEVNDLVGKTFVYRNNSYSVPKNKEDYWDVYGIVIKKKKGIFLRTIEKTSYDCIEVDERELYGSYSLNGYELCNKKEFMKEWNKLMRELEIK